MSILKKMAKKKPQMDLKKMAEVISNIKKLIDMKLLSVDLSTRKFSIQPVLFENRDSTFKNNWLKAVALYWNAETGNSGGEGEFSICDINTGLSFGVFSLANGFTAST
ncbi:hypothetical protein [Pedobacter gandavensis]|uniref:Uncharacterized protein n=1 Tax=Pedobacter gandavensis TaxID=2679963 RepID=A0ABR6EV88_9SPHI|nr:hypothetical protein [Pedobacter gandavensis]MBB2149170.1 hypothetical protein [Pedobacter gandavensis]